MSDYKQQFETHIVINDKSNGTVARHLRYCGIINDTLLQIHCWPDCKPEGPLFSAEFVCLSVGVCVSDWHFYPSTLTNFYETWSQGPYSDLV